MIFRRLSGVGGTGVSDDDKFEHEVVVVGHLMVYLIAINKLSLYRVHYTRIYLILIS